MTKQHMLFLSILILLYYIQPSLVRIYVEAYETLSQ